MNARATVAAADLMRCVHRLTLPALALETLGLTGLITSWRIAGAAAIVLTIAVIIGQALRRASRLIDTILHEELTPAPERAGERNTESAASTNPGALQVPQPHRVPCSDDPVHVVNQPLSPANISRAGGMRARCFSHRDTDSQHAGDRCGARGSVLFRGHRGCDIGGR